MLYAIIIAPILLISELNNPNLKQKFFNALDFNCRLLEIIIPTSRNPRPTVSK